MQRWIGNAEIERHLVDERRVRERNRAIGEVCTDREHEPVLPPRERGTLEQRAIATTVGVQPKRAEGLGAVPLDPQQRDLHACGRRPAGGIEDMRGELSHRSSLSLGQRHRHEARAQVVALRVKCIRT